MSLGRVRFLIIFGLIVPNLLITANKIRSFDDFIKEENRRIKTSSRRTSSNRQQDDSYDTWQVNDVRTDTKVVVNNPTGPLVEDIKCDTREGFEHFTALITLPAGFQTVPMFEDSLQQNPSVNKDCVMTQTDHGSSTFKMKVNDFDACGVEEKRGSDGKTWLSVALRFPFVGGLLMREDIMAMIMCRPQDRTITRSYILDTKMTVPQSPKSVFSNSAQEFNCKMDLMMRPAGRSDFSQPIPLDGVVEVGQDIQLRTLVRPGDGWRFAKLRDVTVQRVSKKGLISPAIPAVAAPTPHHTASPPVLFNDDRSYNNRQFDEPNGYQQNGFQRNNFQRNENGNYGQNGGGNGGSGGGNYEQNGGGGPGNGFQMEPIAHPPPRTLANIPPQGVRNNGGPPRERYTREVHSDGRHGSDMAFLVFSDGCRNPAMKAAAPHHPFRDPINPLQITFNFKAFMFQDMEEGDAIRITAKVTACLDVQDCQPSLCSDDDKQSFGRRRRKRSSVPYPFGPSQNHTTEEFVEKFDIRVVLPEQDRFSKRSESRHYEYFTPESMDMQHHYRDSLQREDRDQKCRMAILLVSTMAGLFSVAITTAAAIVVKVRSRRLIKI